MSAPTAPQPLSSPDRTADPDVHRFPHAFASFELIGTLLRPPEYGRTRQGRAVAALALAIAEDRDLEVLLFDTQVNTLKQALQRITPGTTVYVRGQIQGPRTHRRETAQFVVRQLLGFPGTGQAPAGPAHAPKDKEAPSAAA